MMGRQAYSHLGKQIVQWPCDTSTHKRRLLRYPDFFLQIKNAMGIIKLEMNDVKDTINNETETSIFIELRSQVEGTYILLGIMKIPKGITGEELI